MNADKSERLAGTATHWRTRTMLRLLAASRRLSGAELWWLDEHTVLWYDVAEALLHRWNCMRQSTRYSGITSHAVV